MLDCGSVRAAQVFEQPGFDLAARLLIKLGAQGAGAQIGFEFTQLIAMNRDIRRAA